MFYFKMLKEDLTNLEKLLASDDKMEQGCFILTEEDTGYSRTTFRCKEIIPIEKDELVIQTNCLLSVSPQKMLTVAKNAKSKGLGIFMVHTHPMSNGHVEFSNADDNGNRDTFSFFYRIHPNATHGCLVFDQDIKSVCGRIYDQRLEWNPISKVIAYGASQYNYLNTCIDGIPKTQHKSVIDFSRQSLLLTREGQLALSSLNIGIIGAGGIGSLINVLWTHSSDANITIIDNDTVELSNLSRLIGSKPAHAEDSLAKVDCAKEYTEQVNPAISIKALKTNVESDGAFKHLLDLDLIICGTDTATSRVFINNLCHQHYIPVLELGVQFTTCSETGDIVNDVGRVNLMEPSTPCLECCSLIDRKKLEYEVTPDELKEQRVAEGYIKGFQGFEPSMMAFNMEVAARGMQTILGYFLGLFPVQTNIYESFSFVCSARPKHHYTTQKRKKSDCVVCG